MYSNDETTFAHDCNKNRIQFPKHDNRYLMDPHSQQLLSLWQNYVATSGGQFDAIEDDTTNNFFGATAMPCNFNQGGWTAELNTMITNLGRPVLYNGLGNIDFTHPQISTAIGLNRSSIGGMMEGCYSALGDTNPKPHEPIWRIEENTELRMAALHKLFICRGLNIDSAVSSIDSRIYMAASFFLTYDPATSMLSEKFATPSRFGGEPESQLVPTLPFVPMPTTIAGLKLSSWVYGREYSACYLRGQAVGPCAMAVNIDPMFASHPFPWRSKYGHTLVLSGGGLLDGGTIATDGPAPPVLIPGVDAVIAFQ